MSVRGRGGWAGGVLLGLLSLFGAEAGAQTAKAVPAVAMPQRLTLAEALRLFRQSGLDLLLADAAVMSAEGNVHSAGAIYNPNLGFNIGPTFNYSANPPGGACRGCQQLSVIWTLSDNGALLDVLVGKRGLRLQVARAALFAARLSRADAQRILESQLKQLYMQVALSRIALSFVQEIQATLQQTLELNKLRYPKVIDEGALARIEIQKLEADQGVDAAAGTLRQAQVGLAQLLGVREVVPDYEVELELFKFQVPAELNGATEQTLLARALQVRPDLRGMVHQQERARAALTLARRLQFPDVNLQASYVQLGVGQDAGQPASLVFGLGVNLPIFYQQQGEIRRARADLVTQELQYAKTLAQIRSDIGAALAGYRAAREQVERMESTMLGSARTARAIVNLQYKAGAATLIDFLDAQRSYIATNQEYFQDLANYWTAVYQLEQAVGVEWQR